VGDRYTYVGSLTKSITSAWLGSDNKPLWQQITLLVLVIVSSIALIVFLTYIARREIKRAMERLDAAEQEQSASRVEVVASSANDGDDDDVLAITQSQQQPSR